MRSAARSWSRWSAAAPACCGAAATSWTGAARVPEPVRGIAVGAVATTLLLFVAGSVLLTVALLANLGPAANVLSLLHADVSGGLLYTLLVAAVAPNAVLLTGSYLLGPGFAVGTGTLVSPASVVLGPVPAFPLLAALPSPGTPPDWFAGLVALPVLAAALGVVVMQRRHPVFSYEAGAARGLGSGLRRRPAGHRSRSRWPAARSGPAGCPTSGAPLLDTLLAATVPRSGVGGLFGGVVVTWWARRR